MTIDSYRPQSERGAQTPDPASVVAGPHAPAGPLSPTRASRPEALGTRHAVAAGHPLAALAAHRILEAGGNAVDAGVAAGICLGVVHPDIVSFAGVAPAPSPAMVLTPDGDVMAFGTPGGDVQAQAMLQVLLNLTVFDMSPQRAVEAPRFATQSFPDSFWPHRYFPGRVTLEGRIPEATVAALAARGHEVHRWGDWEWRAGGVCLARMDADGVRWGAADPRRDSYAVAW